jgi:hypothetical protein
MEDALPSLTGAPAETIAHKDIKDKEAFWKNSLMRTKKAILLDAQLAHKNQAYKVKI